MSSSRGAWRMMKDPKTKAPDHAECNKKTNGACSFWFSISVNWAEKNNGQENKDGTPSTCPDVPFFVVRCCLKVTLPGWFVNDHCAGAWLSAVVRKEKLFICWRFFKIRGFSFRVSYSNFLNLWCRLQARIRNSLHLEYLRRWWAWFCLVMPHS